MIRRLTSSMALATLCIAGNAVVAQEAATQAPSAKANVQMASYSAHYASTGCQSCNTGGGYAAVGGPNTNAYGRVWGGAQSSRDCARFYHYPYVYYPQNFIGNEYFRSSDSMYYRYPPEMQIPVYNRHWHNYYPSNRRFHWGIISS